MTHNIETIKIVVGYVPDDRILKLNRRLRGISEPLEGGDTSNHNDVCMCGGQIGPHGCGGGHSPVSVADYYQDTGST